MVGLPDKAVGESRERVRAALNSMGLALPPKRITVNLSPADVVKEGSHFDLPIALGLLAAMGVLPMDEIAGYTALGELALDGGLTPVAIPRRAAYNPTQPSDGRGGGLSPWRRVSIRWRSWASRCWTWMSRCTYPRACPPSPSPDFPAFFVQNARQCPLLAITGHPAARPKSEIGCTENPL